MRDIYLILNSIIAVSLLVLSITTLINDVKSFVNRVFFAFASSVSVWLVAACVSNDVRNSEVISLHGNYLVFLFSYFASYFLLWFVVFIVSNKKIENTLRAMNIPMIIVGLISATPLVVGDVQVQGDVYAVDFGPLAIIYIIFLMAQLAACMWVLKKGLGSSTGRKHIQIKIIWRSLVVALPILLITQFIAPAITGSFDITDIGILVMAVPVVSLYLGVVRHGLFDIRLAAVRVVAYVMSLITLSAIYYALALVVSSTIFKGELSSSVSISPINVALALILAFIFQPIKKFFDKITDKIFYSDRYDSDEFFARLNRILSSTTNLKGLLERTALEIGDTLKSDNVSFLVFTSGNKYITAGSSNRKSISGLDANEIKQRYGMSSVVIVASMLDTNDPIRRLMVSRKIEIILPLVQSKRIIGYLCLGSHRNYGYKSRDMKVLSTISDELVIAIQNALSIQEVKDLNENLQQRIDAATKELRASNAQLQRLDKAKDEFVSMASHQLRTPLTSIKGYVSMILDGDVGEINDTMRHMLDEAFMSSERMVNLINDFLNMSRIQTGKFMIEKVSVDLSKVIKQEIDSLQPSAIAHDLSFVYKQPTNFPMVNVDEGKIRQVIMNFADNAIYYSKPNTKIDIIVESNKDTISFMVKDHGIGVPESEQANLFTKFFRAANAKKQRPDGTGVGLYLAKRIVDAHDGRIIFESTEGQGSTFGFSIPIKQS